MATTTAEPQKIPTVRRARQAKIALPGQPAANQMGYVDPVAWQKEQNRLQKKAVEGHEANKARERAEREQEERQRALGQGRTLEEVVGGGVREVQPDPDNWQNQNTGIPMRGPKTSSDGRYLSDGQVPVRRGRKVKGRVAEAKQAAGRVSEARNRVRRNRAK